MLDSIVSLTSGATMIPKPNQLSRAEIKGAFRRSRGAKAELARELGISKQNITDWFTGRGRSKRVDAAIRARAVELILAERVAAKSPKEQSPE